MNGVEGIEAGGNAPEPLTRRASLNAVSALLDFGSKTLARLQQVPVLNLADLARALRPVVVAGDELELNLVKEGRDPHQAVGYLPDGTMIVVNQGRPHIGRIATVVVSSALQTGAGRLIFAELKENAGVTARLRPAPAPLPY